MLDVVRPAFAALRWLNRERFDNSPDVASGIDQLEREVEVLVALPLRGTGRHVLPASLCPSCGGDPTPPTEHSPTPYCSHCLDIVMPGLDRIRSSEEGFGTDAI